MRELLGLNEIKYETHTHTYTHTHIYIHTHIHIYKCVYTLAKYIRYICSYW